MELLEKTFADVGVRANRMYVALRSDQLNDTFFNDGILTGVQGISGSRSIWMDHGPNSGRDILLIMKADEVVKLNRIKRVQYHNADQLMSNNSALLCRLLECDITKENPMSLINQVYGWMKVGLEFRNMVLAMCNILDKHRSGSVVTPDFPDFILSNVEDYRRLCWAAAKMIDEPELIRYFSKQNSKAVYKSISYAVERVASTYALEHEWVVQSKMLVVPKSSKMIVAIDMDTGRDIGAMQDFMTTLRGGMFEYSIVDFQTTIRSLKIGDIKRR